MRIKVLSLSLGLLLLLPCLSLASKTEPRRVSCRDVPDVATMMSQSDVVFSGRVVGMHDPIPLGADVAPEDLVLDYAFEISKIWKGSPADTIWVRAYRETKFNSLAIAHEQDYVVYGFEYEGVLWTDPCTRTTMMRQGKEDLYWLGEATTDRMDGRTPVVTIDSLIHQLQTGNSVLKKEALQALVGIPGEEARIVPIMLEQFESGASYQKIQIAEALGSLGKAATPAIPVLVAAAELPDSQLRYALAQTLGSLGIHSDEVFKGLVAILGDRNRRTRSSAAKALAKLSAADESLAWTHLKLTLTHSDPHLRLGGFETLRNGFLSFMAVEAHLVEGLADQETEVRLSAARALSARPALAQATVEKIRAAKSTEEEKPEVHRHTQFLNELARALHNVEVGVPKESKP